MELAYSACSPAHMFSADKAVAQSELTFALPACQLSHHDLQTIERPDPTANPTVQNALSANELSRTRRGRAVDFKASSSRSSLVSYDVAASFARLRLKKAAIRSKQAQTARVNKPPKMMPPFS